ncbi:uncharacterized protein LOC124147790 isoform X1 [Haliotis rufescens]|uniref:uncharacterized protein LOC124147790 isoform X1 n=2 Tax=Haliotis rufescens TaxID=6454 RepID=UPI00201F3C74|nr:uncharacterized protein LOC124147790 isoform X1 [Haliotis rufescens]
MEDSSQGEQDEEANNTEEQCRDVLKYLHETQQHASLHEKIRNLEHQLEEKDFQNRQLQEDISLLQQKEEELTQMLDSVSLTDEPQGNGNSFAYSMRRNWRSLSSRMNLSRLGRSEKRKQISTVLSNIKKKMKLPTRRSRTKDAVVKTDAETQTSSAVVDVAVLKDKESQTPGVYPERVAEAGPVYVLSDVQGLSRISITCPHQELDTSRVNTECCHVTDDGQLKNCPPTDHGQQGLQRFQKCFGTCSTPGIPLPTTTATPLSPAQYWEAEALVDVKDLDKLWKWKTCLEIGVAEEESMDNMSLYRQAGVWCIRVADCKRVICTQIWIRGNLVTFNNIMPRSPGTSATLSFGIALDVHRGRIAFFDLDRYVVLHKTDVVFKQTVYRMFSVHPFSDELSVKVKLTSGNNVVMTQQKQELICNALAQSSVDESEC